MNSAPDRVLVTGASGFLGRAVTAALSRDGCRVRAAVRSPPRIPFGSGIEVAMHPDLADGIDWRPLVEGIDVVIHLAGIAHTGPGIAPELYDRVNRAATEQAALAARQAGVRRFVFVSSIRAQCGAAADTVLTERDPATPTDAYGRSKLAAEQALRASGVPFTILRPVLLYGPGVKGNFASLLRAARSPWPLPFGSFTGRRSLLAVDNFIAALRFVMTAPQTGGETYLVADPGPALSLAELIATLRQAQGRRPLLLPLPTVCFELPLRMLGRHDLWQRIGGDLRADPGRLVAAGWRPLHDTRAGLSRMMHLVAAEPRDQ